MEIKMLEYYQGHRNKGVFAPDEVKPVAKKKPAAKKKAVKK